MLCRVQSIVFAMMLLFSFSVVTDIGFAGPVLAKKSSKKKSTKKRSSRSRSKKRTKSRSKKRSRSRSRRRTRAKPKPKPPTKAELEAKARRESAYSSLNAAYQLYDSAINLRMKGDYKAAMAKFNQSLDKITQQRSYQRGSSAGTMAALTYYELGKTAEAHKDLLTAKDSYAKCLNIMPAYTPASVALVNIYAGHGQIDLALAKAKQAVSANPKDPRGHLLVSLLSGRKGEAEVAKREMVEAQRLLSVEAQIIPKNNAKQKSIVRVSDFLKGRESSEAKEDVAADESGSRDEVADDDAIEENESSKPGASSSTDEIDVDALIKHDAEQAENN